MVALLKAILFQCLINEQILDYNGKNFLAHGTVCPQKRQAKEKKNLKKFTTNIEKLTAYHNKET